MMDEDIRGSSDLRAASKTDAADAVKFKLMKAGGVKEAVRLIEEAKSYGFDVVLGNGFQSTVGCLLEGKVWNATRIGLPGEFNGWIKQDVGSGSALQFDDGALKWSGGKPGLDTEVLENCVKRQSEF